MGRLIRPIQRTHRRVWEIHDAECRTVGHAYFTEMLGFLCRGDPSRHIHPFRPVLIKLPEKPVRLTLELSKDSSDRIEDLIILTNARNRVEVFRNAMKLYDLLVRARASGDTVKLVRRSGESMEVDFE